eukprot:scaffold24364_cov132-Cylindrotheca_fusiformis.AAC.1
MKRQGRHKLVSLSSSVPKSNTTKQGTTITISEKTNNGEKETIKGKGSVGAETRGNSMLPGASSMRGALSENGSIRTSGPTAVVGMAINQNLEHHQGRDAQSLNMEKNSAPPSSLNLQRVGRNKLKLSHGTNRSTQIDTIIGRKRPLSWAAKGAGVAKRIAIQPSKSNMNEETTANHDDDDDNNDPKPSSQEQSEPGKLTDFAFRETRKVIQREPATSRKWSANGGGKNASSATTTAQPTSRRSMGLVRVQPNTEKTPVCTTFLKGIQCNDKFCAKRHDVPKEFAMPVCLFFQRHGQCLKGEDCRFRHVKVNPRAMVCPSFALLGFCEDQDCTMKHEQKRPATK